MITDAMAKHLQHLVKKEKKSREVLVLSWFDLYDLAVWQAKRIEELEKGGKGWN